MQKEYVVVPDALLGKTSELRSYFEISRGHVGSMKPTAGKKTR